MGETKEKTFHRGLSIVRIVTAALSGIFFLAALAQIIFFQDIKLTFVTKDDAQQVSSMTIKKGNKVDLPKPLKPGSYFLGWSLEPDGEVIKDSTGLLSDTTLYAKWDGAEKYAVLSVNGLPYREVNIFYTRVDGLTADELNNGKYGDDSWRVLDDYAIDNDNRKDFGGIMADPYNNFSRFLGWQYLNAYNTYNDLLYTINADGTAGSWTWVKRDKDNNVIESIEIDDEHKFYPPNYRTTFKALLEYRTVNIQFFDYKNSSKQTAITFKLGSDNVALKDFNIFKDNPDAHFSHWQLREGQIKQNYIDIKDKYDVKVVEERPQLAAIVDQVQRRYQGGETITLDPMLYYYGSDLWTGNKSELQVILRMDAVYWDEDANETNGKVYQYSVQSYTDQNSGKTYKNFKNVAMSELSLENPVAYDETVNCLWLYYNPQILSYSFYDHNGVYHTFNVDKLKGNKAIAIGESVELLGEQIYFNDKWGINIAVNYPSAAVGVTIKFNYDKDNDLYLLPNYLHNTENLTETLNSRIGDTFEILSCEKYMKVDNIFMGWRIKGDDSGRLYTAGESFTVPNFDSATQSSTIEFVADWHLQRLLFNFDFEGGSWATEEGPDFTIMKGAYHNRVRVVNEAPVKFGYDFDGWTLEDNDNKVYQPGDDIIVGVKFQTLHAHWKAKRLRLTFRFKNNNTDVWQTLYINHKEEKNINGGTLYSGDTIELPHVSNNDFYIFDGWQIGERVDKTSRCVLTTEVLSQLETVSSEDNQGPILDVIIYAAQTKCSVELDYELTIANDNELINLLDNDSLIESELEREVPQGGLFYDYYPFNVALAQGNYAVFDTHGRQFIGWEYYLNGEYYAITPTTRIPSGISKNSGVKIKIIGSLSEPKSLSVEFYNNAQQKLRNPVNTTDKFNYGNSFRLPNYNTVNITNKIEGWGTFVGWSFEPDYKAGNPKVIYDVYYYANNHNGTMPELNLSSRNDNDPTEGLPYLINMDRYAKQTNGMNYTLKLYAVYANDYAMANYQYLQPVDEQGHLKVDSNGNPYSQTQLRLPVYSNTYAQTKIGGRTVGYDSADYVSYGNAVLDDNHLREKGSGYNFVGWQIVLPDGVSPETQSLFADKIWFPGDYLPSVDCDLNFNPIYVVQSSDVKTVTVGNRVYRVYSLINAENKVTINEDVDIVALPRGIYTVEQGGIVINSSREVHVVVSSDVDSIITLKPRAIQCDTIKEFYVGDNLIITGSPVVGQQFQAYRVKKGYRLVNEGSVTPTQPRDTSTKYDFTASINHGLLISKDGSTLYGVPCNSNLDTESLAELIEQSITHITEYALSDINNMQTIRLLKADNLQIDANALNGVKARKVVLPLGTKTNNVVVSAQVLSGKCTNLQNVTFGDNTTDKTNYAFVEDGMVYYLDENIAVGNKLHLMYVLQTANWESVDFVGQTMVIPDSVTCVEPQALMGLDWTKFKAVKADNAYVDLQVLMGIPNAVPVFTNVNNPKQGRTNSDFAGTGAVIQSYTKVFKFKCTGYTEKNVELKYGQTFRVFSAQNNNYDIYFDVDWSQFVCWRLNNGRTLRVGEVYQVGKSEEIIGADKNTLEFDASSKSCWQAYPVRFITYQDRKYNYSFKDIDENTYTIGDLIGKNLNNIYLPALNQNDGRVVADDGSVYQFIGWSKNPGRSTSAITDMLWNKVAVEDRILPNKTTVATLNKGNIYSENGNQYRQYFALYEKVTPNLAYTFESDGSYSVNRISDNNYGNITSLNIPFARYNDQVDKYGKKDRNYGYMAPVISIGDRAFESIQLTLSEINIGGAISSIGNSAFNNVNAKQIIFNHQGRNIVYNANQGSLRHLTIGENAFSNNDEIGSLTLPDSTETIDTRAFENCLKLQTVRFASESPYLRNLGNFVFYNDTTLTNNAVVGLLENDKNKTRFSKVGDGIFWNTACRSTETANDRIVWGNTVNGTVLHMYLKDNSSNTVLIKERFVAGWAFVNLGAYDQNGNLVPVTLKFDNKNIQIKANAFSNSHNSVTTVKFNNKEAPVTSTNVDAHAFDTLEHSIRIYVSGNLSNENGTGWDQRFANVNNVNFQVSNIF